MPVTTDVPGPIKPRSRSLLFNGAVFVVIFVATAGAAWSFMPTAQAPRPPEKQETRVDDKAKVREAELLARVEHLEEELARKVPEPKKPEPRLIDSIPDVPLERKTTPVVKRTAPVRVESKPTWSLFSSTQWGTSETSSNRWPSGDVESATRVLRAIRAQNDAWGICKNLAMVGPPYKPWEIESAWEKGEFIAHMERASHEAKLARPDTLRRMHPDLPRAWQDFVTGTYGIAWVVRNNREDRAVREAWDHWLIWERLHGREVRLPPGAKN